MTAELSDLEKSVQESLREVRDDPEARYQRRENFYRQYGFDPEGPGYGSSELSFLKWEIKRGVLNPLTHPTRPGSPWWRGIRDDLFYESELAVRVDAARIEDPEISNPVRMWLAYLRRPSGRSWYRAHNTSIVSSYLKRRDAASQENLNEQIFLNVVLYRLLFAQSLVEDVSLLGDLGPLIANPKLPAVHDVIALPGLYPRHYPLQDNGTGRGRERRLEILTLLDEGLILPEIHELYSLAAEWSNTPELRGLVHGRMPIYPALEPPGPWHQTAAHRFARKVKGAFSSSRSDGKAGQQRGYRRRGQ